MSNPPPPPASEPPDASPIETFAAFGLDARIVDALTKLGIDTPTPIQSEAIPALLRGRDVIGGARTGSGKTAAFGLPLLERVKDGGGTAVRALVLTPTRELALQVTEALRDFAKGLAVRIVTVYGGAAYGPQLQALSRGVPIVVGTPGRVLDHLERKTLDLSHLELLVLDEADEMLRMGFLEDVQKVLDASPPHRQIALFSASMPDPIRVLAKKHLRDPVEVHVERMALTVHHIEQRALLVPERHKTDALTRILAVEPITAALIFARTRAGCAAAADELARRGISVDALHGDLNQAARERVLTRFRAGGLQVVVATDVAARGIDVEHISHVINFDMPSDPEGYVHRIGRTGRAGRKGVAISLVTPMEVRKIRFLERTLDAQIEKIDVPSDAAIARAKRGRLVERVRAEAVREPGIALEAMLEELCEGLDARRVAAAALRLLATEQEMALDDAPDERAPGWGRTAPDKARPSPAAGPGPGPGSSPKARAALIDEVEIFLPIGSARGVRPGDLVGALANELGVPGESIGRVTILDHKSFVRLARDAADELLATYHQVEIRGRQVPLARSRGPVVGGGEARPTRSPDGRRAPPRNEGFKPKKRWQRTK